MRQTWIPGVSSPVPLYAPYSPLVPVEVARRSNPSRQKNNRSTAPLMPPPNPVGVPHIISRTNVVAVGAQKGMAIVAAGILFAFPFSIAYHGDSLIPLEPTDPMLTGSMDFYPEISL